MPLQGWVGAQVSLGFSGLENSEKKSRDRTGMEMTSFNHTGPESPSTSLGDPWDVVSLKLSQRSHISEDWEKCQVSGVSKCLLGSVHFRIKMPPEEKYP